MKRKALICLVSLVLALPFLCALAEDQSVAVQPGDSFQAQFVLIENPDQAVAALAWLEYDHSVFELVPSDSVKNDSLILDVVYPGIPEGYTVKALFRVRSEAADGQYTISVCADEAQNMVREKVSMVFSSCSVNVAKKESAPEEEWYQLGKVYFDAANYEKAVKYFLVAADQGSISAQSSLGVCYFNGYGVKQDYAEAVKYFRLAADQGNSEALYMLGSCYENGYGVQKNEEEASNYYRLAAEKGHAGAAEKMKALDADQAEAWFDLGKMYYDEQNYEKALKNFSLAADLKSSDAQYYLGLCYENGFGAVQDYAEAAKYYRLSADQGNSDAQYRLGIYYAGGMGVEQDFDEAVKYYRMAADQGNSDAQAILGACYETGLMGVKKDEAEAIKYYQLAADQGHKDAAERIRALENDETKAWFESGKQYFDKNNYGEALKYFRQAADQGNRDAQYYLGICYYNGYGVERDYSEAVKYFHLAADQGHAEGQCRLGICYYFANGIEQDYEEAVKYLRLSADQGNTEAMSSLGFIYFFGKEENTEEGLKYFQLAAAQNGDAAGRAQVRLGWCYQNGVGVKKDLQKALEYYQLALGNGFMGVQDPIDDIKKHKTEPQAEVWATHGYWCYEYLNYERAVEYYRKAADQGNDRGQYELAKCYFYGNGVEQDYAKAVKYYRLAHKQGNSYVSGDEAYVFGQKCYNKQYYTEAVQFFLIASDKKDADAYYYLGMCYEYGQGVEKNLNQARKYYQMASDNHSLMFSSASLSDWKHFVSIGVDLGIDFYDYEQLKNGQ